MPRQRALSDLEIISVCVSNSFVRLYLMGKGWGGVRIAQVGQVRGDRRWEERGELRLPAHFLMNLGNKQD